LEYVKPSRPSIVLLNYSAIAAMAQLLWYRLEKLEEGDEDVRIRVSSALHRYKI
jgi:hypothetical protein